MPRFFLEDSMAFFIIMILFIINNLSFFIFKSIIERSGYIEMNIFII